MDGKQIEKDINDIIYQTNQDLTQENANTNGSSPTGMMGLFASVVGRDFAKSLLNPKVLAKFEEGYIHIHDFDYYSTGTTTCSQIPLGKLLKEGFTVGNCFMRQPHSITAAMDLASIIFQANQNEQHGGQAFPNWDYDLAPYVEMSYNNHLDDLANLFNDLDVDNAKLDEIAMERTIAETYQAAEAFIHNSNSMLSRGGGQTPFMSINFGLDTSKWGRIVTEQTLKAQIAGLGDNSTPIFPILIFKVHSEYNMLPESKNYDLFKLALECTSKRMFPNYQFIETEFNSRNFDINNPRTHVATMGCRTRVFENQNGETTSVGRGNNSFTTLNLPMIAMESKETGVDFQELVEQYCDLVYIQLEDRIEWQRNRLKKSFKFLYGEKVWEDVEDYDIDGKVGDILKQGSQSIGFIGLAEALVILKGKHHGESEDSQNYGLETIKLMNKKCDEYAKESGNNYSVLATPAESYCGKAWRKFKAKYGVVERVTDDEDRAFFTNSNHIPVDFDITFREKIRLESAYHPLTLAGHILYVEVDGNASINIDAMEDIVLAMAHSGTGYGSINVPLDRCRDCGAMGVFPDYCYKCESTNISRIRRITGYLVGDLDKWNTAKQKEESKRVKHGK